VKDFQEFLEMTENPKCVCEKESIHMPVKFKAIPKANGKERVTARV
jgi:hypothetical protein